MTLRTRRGIAGTAVSVAILVSTPALALDSILPQWLPTGQHLTPEAAAGSRFEDMDPGLPAYREHRAGQAASVITSPDGKTLAILTSGFNRLSDPHGRKDPAASNEYVFLFDIAGQPPRQTQVLQIPDTDSGIAFSPDAAHLYVSGGVDDNLHVFDVSQGAWKETGVPVALGHTRGLGVDMKPSAAGLAVTADGRRVIVADRHNDAITVVDVGTRTVTGELDLRPGRNDPAQSGVAGGEYPDWIVIKGNDRVYVSSQRDREIVAVDLGAAAPRITARIKIRGTPNRMVLGPGGSLLYAASDNSDLVSVIDTTTNTVRETIDAAGPDATDADGRMLHGAAPNSLALAPDGATLYATLGGLNALAIIPLGGALPHKVAALVPTGWYPTGVAAAADMLYVVNARSDPGANPGGCYFGSPVLGRTADCAARNRYVLQLSRAGFLSLPVPKPEAYRTLTTTVAANDGLGAAPDAGAEQMMAALRRRIRHVIYIVKENRTYDQVLGDLGRGNGEADLALFGAPITPNEHALARDFVTLDNFYDPGEVSGNGWPWSTAARETDVGTRSIPMAYADRGQSYDVEGTNRNINVALATLSERRAADDTTPNDPDLLPGVADVAAPDAATGETGHGHLWDAALRAGLSVRNYGFHCDTSRYDEDNHDPVPVERDPAAAKMVVAFPADTALIARTDLFFRGFDLKLPDFYREREWEREFRRYVADGDLPNLSLVRFMTDHTGNFAHAIDGIDTPEAQVSDNDYAVGRLVEAVAKSPYRDSTLIFVVEDDAQDGPDHVDVHRSTAFVAGPFVKQGQVVSTHYSTVNMLRTIEDVLGIAPLGLYDAHQPPMADLFDLKQKTWSFSAEPSAALLSSALPLPKKQAASARQRRFAFAHDATWWSGQTRGYDWSREDRMDADAYNRVLWAGLGGLRPYPDHRAAGGD
jgi:YVTN family beta-propeller protein